MHSVEPVDNGMLLAAMMELFAGAAAYIAFEGDLSDCNLRNISGASDKPQGYLKRQSLLPSIDFVVLPLDAYTITPILEAVIPHDIVSTDILHISITCAGELEFSSQDQFGAGCIWCGPSVSRELLEAMHKRGIIHSFEQLKEA